MPPNQPDTPWWHPTRHVDRAPLLRGRGRVQQTLRTWFGAQGFTEVTISALQVSPGNEAHLHGFATMMQGETGAQSQMYLHTSPEFAMKKLLAAGERQINCFAQVYRNGERGVLHHPEFTMLEWYRSGADYTQLMSDCAAILRLAVLATGAKVLQFRGLECDPLAPIERLSLTEAFDRYTGIDLAATLDENGQGNGQALRQAMQKAGLSAGAEHDWATLFSQILVGQIEPNLGIGAPTALDRYPACEAALARRCPDDQRFSERFELYACSVELANGFGELTDPAEQRLRFEAEMAEKQRLYGETYPLDEDFLTALALMPDASGIALGFDRLVMLATGAPRIDDVIWAPVALPAP
ncbi:MAG: EF-P lysine aminoacylase GenX [Rhodobacteraceae bacterium]|nr:EF-P lysine aminoacylase GenX [Paracoccaceae bacterium]